MKYTEVKSTLIKSKIQGANWSEKEEIDQLIKLEKYILNPPHGWAANLHLHHLKSTFSSEYLELLKELSPDKYAKEVTLLNDAKLIAVEIEQINQKIKENWLKAGGKP